MEKAYQSNKIQSEALDRENNPSFFAVINALLSDLPERSQEIMKKRFGLIQEKPQTLEKIGLDYGITRERVRQIMIDALKKVSQKKNDPAFKQAEEKIIFTIGENSGIIKETEIVEKLSHGDYREANSLIMFCECSEKIKITEEKEIKKSWFLNSEVIENAKKSIATAEDFLKKESKLLSSEEMVKKAEHAKEKFSKQEFLDYLGISSKIEKNKFQKWGMSHWMQINPKGTRERIYAVLKEKNKPLHFTEIARFIDEYGFSKKKAHVQTVHNELIKNDHFVLIGRGIYALKEWGYAKGTIKDVLEKIFKKSRKSLSKEEVVEEVSKVRQVKKTTILINLNNDKFFAKQNNLYSMKRS